MIFITATGTSISRKLVLILWGIPGTNLIMMFWEDCENMWTFGLEKPLNVSKLNEMCGNLEDNPKGSQDNSLPCFKEKQKKL